jgi:uncharacterized membrane protein
MTYVLLALLIFDFTYSALDARDRGLRGIAWFFGVAAVLGIALLVASTLRV